MSFRLVALVEDEAGEWESGMDVRQARRAIAEMLARLDSRGPTAQRHWLSQHGVRLPDARAEREAGGLTAITRRVGEQLLDAVADDVADVEELRQIVHPEPVRVSPPGVLGYADASPGPPAPGMREGGETLYAYSREHEQIGWLNAEVQADGTVSLHGIYTAPDYRGHGVAVYLLLVGRGHFGAWRSWVPETTDPRELSTFTAVAGRYGIRVGAREPEQDPSPEGSLIS